MRRVVNEEVAVLRRGDPGSGHRLSALWKGPEGRGPHRFRFQPTKGIGCLGLAGLGLLGFFGLCSYNLSRVSQETARRVASTPVTTAPAAPQAPAAATSGNVAHDALMALPDPRRNNMLSRVLTSRGEAYRVNRHFFQGFDRPRNAFSNVGCTNGKSFAVMVYNDGQGSTKVLVAAS